MKKRVGSLFLILLLLTSLISTAVWADETDPGGTEAIDEAQAEIPADAGLDALSDEAVTESDSEAAVPIMGASPRVWLTATSGGGISVVGPEDSQGDAKLFFVEAGQTFEVSTEVPAGSAISLTAQPSAGKIFKGWYRYWNSTEPELVSSEASYSYTMPTDYGDTLTAVFDSESTAPKVTYLSRVNLLVKAPLPGQTTETYTAIKRVLLQTTYHCRITEASWHAELPTLDSSDATPVFSGALEEGKTYYIRAKIETDEGYAFKKAGEPEGADPTIVNIKRAALPYGNELAVTNEWVGGSYKSMGIVVVAFGPDVPIALPALELTPPKAGQNATNVNAADCIRMTAGEHCYLSDPRWVINSGTSEAPAIGGVYEGIFAPGQTYYIKATLVTNDGYIWKMSGNEVRRMAVDGGTLVYINSSGSDGTTTNGYLAIDALIAFTPTYTPRIWLEVTSGGTISGVGPDNGGAAMLFDVNAGQTIELTGGYYQFAPGSTVSLTAVPASGNTFKGWYRMWNSTSPELVSSSARYEYTLPTQSGDTLTAVFTSQSQEAGTVTRLYGSNRYKTCLSIATQLKKENGGKKFKSIVLARGTDYPDALAGGYLANVKNAPIILIRDNAKVSHSDNQRVAKWIKANLEPKGTIYVLGSTAAIPKSHVDLVKSGFKVKRLEGKNRFGTNAAILEAIGTKGINEVIVTTGRDFPDALCASALDKPLLIVETKKSKEKKLDLKQKAYLAKLKNPTFYVVGPTSVIPATYETQLREYGNVKRIATDKNAMPRSVQIAEALCPNPQAVALAVNDPFADGLCGGVIANKHKAPLLLVKKGSEAGAAAFVKSKGVYQGLVFGSNKDIVVPNSSVSQILPKAKIVNSEYK